MSIGLGIDTGGTYTDAVLYRFENKKILASAKYPTTPQDLSQGICGAIAQLPAALFSDITRVALSTTLATNACVEDKGCRCALLLMGYDESLYTRLSQEYGLSDTGSVYFLPGRHGLRGQVEEAPDWEHFEAIVSQLPEEIETIGICEYGGIHNPAFEQEAMARTARLTQRPIAAAHELSRQINSLKRAATTCLNARLIPLIRRLLQAVRDSLTRSGIHAPLMIVRGDGSLMTEAFAQEHPIETLLSGPAASVIGGMALTGVQDCVILDMGGTTTDIALVEGGRTLVAENGVQVGSWRTGTYAIAIGTIGLGGDSLITRDQEELRIGPRRAVPLARLAYDHPRVLDKLRSMLAEERVFTFCRGEFFIALRSQAPDLSSEEQAVLAALQAGPLRVEELAEAVGKRPYFLRTETLESLGYIIRSGLTPTDLMHIAGEFTPWCTEAAQIGLRLIADVMDRRPESLHQELRERICRRLYALIVDFLMERQLPREGRVPAELMELGWAGAPAPIMCRFACPYPLVSIGAPTHIFLGETARHLDTQALHPQYAEVANAVGAITGQILAEEQVWIKPRFEVGGVEGYSCHSSQSFAEFELLEDAMDWARQQASAIAAEKATAMGAQNVQVELRTNEKQFTRRGSGGHMLETLVWAVATDRLG